MLSDFHNRIAFETIRPNRQIAPIVFNSAHSGRDYPERFIGMSRLNKFAIRQSEDAYVDELYENAPKMGAPLLRALFPRAYLDVNREPYELDQKMFSETLPSHYNLRSPRVKSGLGTIAKIVAHNRPIYSKTLNIADAQMRIEGIYRPYHLTLQKLLSNTFDLFGHAILIDAHSMPSLKKTRNNKAPDIILGDRYGTSCSPQIIDLVETIFLGAGLKTIRNHPYAGGYITHSYGRPNNNVHVLQIEISRHLYMNEASLKKNDNFFAIKKILDNLIMALIELKINRFTNIEPKAAQ